MRALASLWRKRGEPTGEEVLERGAPAATALPAVYVDAAPAPAAPPAPTGVNGFLDFLHNLTS